MVDVYKAPEAELTKKASSNEYGSIKIGTSGAYSFRIRKVFSEAWKLVKGAKLPFFIAFVIYFICYIGLSFLSTTIAAVFGFEIPSPFDTELSADFNPVSVGIGQLISTVILMLLSTPLIAAICAMGVRRSGKESISGGDVFSRYGSMVPLFFALVLYYILVGIGFLLLVLPGIYLSIAYLMAFPLITEKGLGPWKALETSRKAITKKWFRFFGFFILLFIVTLISLIPLGIGYIWAGPLTMIAFGIAYRNMFGLQRER